MDINSHTSGRTNGVQEGRQLPKSLDVGERLVGRRSLLCCRLEKE